MARSRRREPKRSNAFIGVMAGIVCALILFFGFTKDIPFTQGYRLHAQFESANSIRPNSPVRIAGVEVGKVKAVEGVEGSDSAMLVMELDDTALPLHVDASAKIRPRIFLEGNFFVDLKPGSPSAPLMKSGDTIKIASTATPVQLDQVLTSLQSDSREDLQALLDGMNVSLNSKPTPSQNRELPLMARGQTGAESFNNALTDIPAAEKTTAEVLEALLGTEPHRDVERLIRGSANTAEELGRNEAELKDLITNANIVTGTFASESANLSATISELPGTLASANRAFTALNAAFPSVRAFAIEILPGVEETPATIDAAFPWIEQSRKLVGPNELGGLAKQLSPASADLARLIDSATKLLPQTELASDCLTDVVLPAGDLVIQDEFTTGVENYKEFFYALVGIAGEGQNTDGNGMYVRFQTGGGSQSVSLGSASTSTGQLFGNAIKVPLGNRPAYPGKRPPYKPNEPCYKQKIPDVNGPAAAVSAPNGATTAQVKSVRDKLRREAKLSAVRAKLNPFGSAQRRPAPEKAK